MSNVKVVLMHGKDTSPSEKWYPWFTRTVKEAGIACISPVLPDANNPDIDAWVAVLKAADPDEETILVGHSRGGVAVLRFLERMESGRKVRKVILVATNAGGIKPDQNAESNRGFYSQAGYDFPAIKSHCDDFLVLHSRDDKWVPFADGEENARGLGARFLCFDSYGHFGKGVPEVPELIEEILG